MSRQLLQTIVPQEWDSQDPSPGSGTQRVRFLQNVSDLVDRPVNNRLTASTPATAVACDGKILSTGVGVGPMQPMRYAEFTVKARVTFNINESVAAYVYVFRTLGPIPAAGSEPNAGDVVVGGDAFVGGMLRANVNQVGALSYLDTGLSVTKKYNYYFAVVGPAGSTVNLINASQLLVMERS
jgi:hypothetical protein